MTHRKIFVSVLMALAALAAPATLFAAGKPAWVPRSGVVTHVFDGDTVLVRAGARKARIRLLGIDTPEKNGPYTKAEPLGIAAGARTAQLALGKKVTLIYSGRDIIDKYNRYLAYVILPDGRSLNEILLREGLAEVFRHSSHSLKQRYERLEARAKRARLGIWGLPAGSGASHR